MGASGGGRKRRREPLLPKRSRILISLFSWYSHRYVQRHFHAVRASHQDAGGLAAPGPLIVYLNHPSWWDPLICLVAALHYFPARKHYAPMDATELERYRFFSKLGFFGVEPNSPRGAVALLRVGGAILQESESALWITPQGRFADPRERPLKLQPGLPRLARRVGDCTLLPLAVEYPYGEERLPEVLLWFGEPIEAADFVGLAAEDLHGLIVQRLETAQDALAARAIERDYSEFEVILRSREGVSFFYDMWRRVRAKVHGERIRLGHGKDAT